MPDARRRGRAWSNTWDAWISTSRQQPGDPRYAEVDDALLRLRTARRSRRAAKVDLIDGTLDAPIDLDELGAPRAARSACGPAPPRTAAPSPTIANSRSSSPSS